VTRPPRPRIRRRLPLATVTAIVTVAAAAVSTGAAGATTGGPPDPHPDQPSHSAQQKQQPRKDQPRTAGQSREIASSVLGRDLKFTLTALRSRTDPLAATVQLRVFTFQNGVWKESDQATVGDVDGWFWFPLTGRHAICQFSTASTDPAPVAVSLLVTPSIDCSPTENFQVKDGQITPA
jgi:hypothetical protein